MRTRFLPWATMAMLGMAATGSAQLWMDDFDVDTSANWTVNNGPSDGTANFSFDYSTLGISAAPNSGSTTRGLRLMANQTNGIFSGLSVSPTGKSFSGDYVLKADVWMSFNGPAPVGGSGSTQFGGMGIGSTGTVAQWPGGTVNGVYFGATGDGNSSSDYRAYSSAAPTRYADTSGVYFAGNAAGSTNASHAYYAQFGGNSAPAAQVALFPQQTGTTGAGTQGWAWRDYQVEVRAGLATFSIDGLNIAQVDLSTVTIPGGNIVLLHSDTNATSSTDVNDFLICTIFDNVRVDAVPEPATMAALGLGVAAVIRRRRK